MGKYFISLSWIVLLTTLVFYGAVLIPPEKFWPAGILVYGILPSLIVNLFLLILLLIMRSRAALIPLFAFIMGFLFIKITFHVYVNSPELAENKMIEILSFNIKGFEKVLGNDENSLQMTDWLVRDSADVKCIQEFYNRSGDPILDLVAKMSGAGYNFHLSDNRMGYRNNIEGLAIFTRYPILNRGALLLEENGGNNCIYVDLKIEKDTVRIYNVHLYSMRIPLYAYKDPSNYEGKMKSLIRKLKEGAINRSGEIDQLISHTAQCPYPFIICGDFNDIPYSHNYITLRNHFTNAFEEAGHGFGFSFNHRLFFLRIDHHFVSEGIRPIYYSVDRSMKESDHFPTRGIYQLQ